MPEITKNNEEELFIDYKMLDRIKAEAHQSPRNMARLLMHMSHEDPVQEMIIAMGRECAVTPNRAIGQSESLQLVEGELLLVIFNENGNVIKQIEMAPPGNEKTFLYRLSSTPWHTMIPLSEMVVVHETLQGPFKKSTDPLPEWVPIDYDGLRKFLQEILTQAGLV